MSQALAAAADLSRARGIPEAIDATREACTGLRWHNALRRRIPEAAAESRVRGATASAEIEGARMGLDIVRDLMRGAVTWHDDPDPVERVVHGAVTATAETEILARTAASAPMQALARLHVAAASSFTEAAQVGRPREDGEECRELLELGPAPSAQEARGRLLGVTDLVAGMSQAPTLVVAALVHAELIAARPFVSGNGVVARAMERIIVTAGGLDPTGVVVPELGHLAQGTPAYFGALTAYLEGSMAGVTLWITHCGNAIRSGADEGVRIADAVQAGRLTSGA